MIPTTPQKLAGCLIDPPVSVPVAPKHKSAATAAAEPPEDPPGAKGSFSCDRGLIVFPKKLVLVAEPIANSSKFVLPTKIDPSSNNF